MFKLLKNKKEKEFDKVLNIETTGYVEQNVHEKYNRYEPTLYKDLEYLSKHLTIKSNDILIDFGSGKGRVLFYFTYRFGIYSKGLEVNKNIVEITKMNIENFNNKYPNLKDKIEVIYMKAEGYEIGKNDNIFYFFNPFSLDIFKRIINNIEKSLEEFPRKSTIIMYYNLPELITFMSSNNTFFLDKKLLKTSNKDKHQNFYIYHNY